jgi:hypothetical protein
MPFEPLKAEDLALVNRLLQAHPDLHDTIAIVKQVSAKVKYPITSFDDLEKSLGGPDATVTFRGRTVTMAEARAVVPAYYFPIGSETDLTAKMADLGKALPPPAATAARTDALESAIKLMAPSAIRPNAAIPTIAHEEILRRSGFGKQRPAVGGFSEE